MKKIFILILSGLAFMAVSCQDKLEIEQKGVVSYDNFYASDADADAARADMYVNFLTNVAGTEGIDNPEQVILNYSADDILAAGGNLDDHDGFRVFDEFRYGDATGTLKECYQRYYYAIYHANLIISNFTNENRNQTEPKFTSAKTEQYVAEARVMRAYVHMMTALTWNRPPLMDRLYDADELPTNAESQAAILNWVISECEKAIASGKLPERASVNDKNSTAIMTKGFAQFVAGKAAMFLSTAEGKATARKYLGDLINSGKYALVDGSEYWTNFHVAGDGNCEKIFEPNFVEDPAYTSNAWGFGSPIFRGRWMVANVFLWRIGNLASKPIVGGSDGWNGGAIQNDFAKKFLAHDGDSPRRKACFITEDEFLYGLDWAGSEVNDGTLEQKKADPARGINSLGVFSHGPYFEWKHMVFLNPPKILTGGKEYPKDNIPAFGDNSNQKNFNVARYAEALLLYAEACIGADETAGLAALNEVQKRSGSGKISSKLTFEDVMEEKQYEMWFENCRFHDLVRWSNEGKVDLNKIFNESKIHETVTIVYDEFTKEGKPGYKKEHKLYTEPTPVKFNKFEDKYKYLPFPLDFKTVNPNLVDVLGWASASN